MLGLVENHRIYLHQQYIIDWHFNFFANLLHSVYRHEYLLGCKPGMKPARIVNLTV